ncbi:glycosyltransferase family 4 protein [Paenibacillus koleovorans]|uniref:glycosyltransferase family 4 protein n=1 Tax=Paenibacillus koleovorans TaxID=121608 RepID=UPI000FDBB2A5|nr:glycosyltransferase family 4 protein [Paenibacillus koleovorans]
MNILVINHYAGSPYHGMEYRPYFLAKEWVSLGHSVTIVASTESHLRINAPETTGLLTEQWIDGIQYLWVRTTPYKDNGVKRVINIFNFVIKLIWNSKDIVNQVKPDAVIASSTYPFDIYAAQAIAKKAKAKFIYEVHDLWPLTPVEIGGMSPYHPLIMLMQKAEDDGYRKADRVVSMLPYARSYMLSRGMKDHKFTCIPNGVHISDWQNSIQSLPTHHQAVLEELALKKHFLIGYAGYHGLANALFPMLETALLMKESPISFVLVGNGPLKEELELKAKRLGLTNIYFLPSITKNEIPTFLCKMDVLYIGWNKKRIYEYGVSPNKLMDYMMAAKPVIHSIDAGNDIVAESGCGISVPAEKPEQVKEAIEKLMRLTRSELLEMGNKGKEYVVLNHDYQILAKKFISVLSD